MKIKITVEVVECKTNDNGAEAKRLLPLAIKGIIKKYIGRFRGLKSNVMTWGSEVAIIEIEDEDEDKEKEA